MLQQTSAPVRSRSELETYACPHRWNQVYVLGVRDESDASRRGSTFHKANEYYLGALTTARQSSDPALAAVALRQAYVDQGTPAHLMDDVAMLWSRWTERFELNLDAFLAAEERLTAPGLTCRLDFAYAFSNLLEIHDLKTHYVALTEAQAKKELQSRMYVYLASKVWPGFARYRFVYHFVRLNTSVSVEFEPADMDAIERQLEALAAGILEASKSEEFKAIPGAHCQYCTLACPLEAESGRLPVHLRTMDDAARIAGEVTVLQRALATKRRLLSDYAAIFGPVVAGGLEWSHRPTLSQAFPAAGVIDHLRHHEADVSKLTIGKTALKSFLTATKWSHLRDGLEALATAKAGTKFGSKKVGTVGEEPDESEE